MAKKTATSEAKCTDLVKTVEPYITAVNVTLVPVITDSATYSVARLAYNNAREVLDQATAKKDELYTDPLKAAVKATQAVVKRLDGQFAVSAAPLLAYCAELKLRMEGYITAQHQLEVATAERAAKRLEKKGDLESAEQVRKNASVFESPGNLVRRSEVIIVNKNIVPDEYWTLDMEKLAAAYKVNPEIVIPGTKLETKINVVKR
jgi:hypothetical protein